MKPADNQSILKKIGGMDNLQLISDNFYGRVQEDDRINFFFRWVDLERQSCKMKEYLAHVLGHSIPYHGKSMKAAHGHLLAAGLSPHHFDTILEHLTQAFREAGTSEAIILDIKNILKKTGHAIFG